MGCHCGGHHSLSLLECIAGTTGLEPATSAVTGQRSNQLSYVPTSFSSTYAKSKNLLSFVPVGFFSRFHVYHGVLRISAIDGQHRILPPILDKRPAT
jgi:hypothetical protein